MDWRTELKTLNDWIEKALQMEKGGATVAQIIEFIDWQNHTRYSEKEIEDSLENLFKSGKVRDGGGKRWCLVKKLV